MIIREVAITQVSEHTAPAAAHPARGCQHCPPSVASAQPTSGCQLPTLAAAVPPACAYFDPPAHCCVLVAGPPPFPHVGAGLPLLLLLPTPHVTASTLLLFLFPSRQLAAWPPFCMLVATVHRRMWLLAHPACCCQPSPLLLLLRTLHMAAHPSHLVASCYPPYQSAPPASGSAARSLAASLPILLLLATPCYTPHLVARQGPPRCCCCCPPRSWLPAPPPLVAAGHPACF